MGKRGGGGDGGQAAVAQAQRKAIEAQAKAQLYAARALENSQREAINAYTQGRNQGYEFLNQAQTSSLRDVNPLLPAAKHITQNAFNKVGNFDAETDNLVNEADTAYLAPSQRSVSEQLKNLFSSYGVGGRSNSRAQNAFARFGDEVATNEAMRRFELRNQVRNNFLNEQQNLVNVGMQPIQFRANTVQDFGKARANTALGVGSSLGSAYQQGGQALASNAQNGANQLGSIYQQGGQALAGAQQQAYQNKQNRKASTAGMIGTGLGAITSAASAFSDVRLKENIQPVGRLDNGLTVYSYNFKGSPKTEIGLLAQEVKIAKPETVHQDALTGFLKVDYKKAVMA